MEVISGGRVTWLQTLNVASTAIGPIARKK